MKKNALYFGIAALALLVVSCSKGNEMDTLDNQERVTMIDPWTAIDQSQYKLPLVSGPKVSITAGFEENGETKTTMDVGTSSAKVLWTSGDAFTMYAKEGSGHHEIPFTTTGSGEKVDFSTIYVTPSVSPWHFIYGVTPDELVYDGDNMLFRINVPSDQVAVANKVKDNYLYSYAQATEGLSSNVCFKSMLAFVRFKMSGTIASSVTSVTLTGASALAGHSVLVPAADGTPQMSSSINFGGDVRSSTVTLEGPFAADTYYYFAVVPGTQSSFSLKFSGSTGSTTIISSKTVTFSRGIISDLGEISLGSAFKDPATPSMETIKWNTASAGATKPVTIAVVPDGFTASEMDKYEMLAKAAMNTLFSVEPFKSYKNYFNVYILKVASGASGARITDGTDAEKTRDCFFESAWKKNSYSDMRANDDKLFNYVTDHCPDITSINASTVYHTIKEVPVLMIINDTRYGGRNWSYSTGEAYCMAPYTYSGGGMSWSYPENEAKSDSDPAQGVQATPASRFAEVGSNTGNWLNTMVHEFGGHCFARLKDEYWYNTYESPVEHIDTYEWPVKFGLNVSATYSNPGLDTDASAAGWQFLLDKKASLAASNPLYNRIGVYQGADVSILNRWRSERISCMIDNRFYFSTFQRYLIVKRIMSLAGVTFEDEDAFWAAFKAKDVPIDPVRDLAGSSVMGESDPVPPRPVPLLPPPGLVEVK